MLRPIQELIASLFALLRLAAASVRTNASLAALSLGLAFVLWIFVTETDQGSTRSGTLANVEVPVQAVNVSRGLTLAAELPTVRVRAEASDDVWDDLRAEEFEALVVLSGLGEGSHTVAVELNARTSRGGLRVLGSSPGELEILLVPLFSKSVPVQLEIRGVPPSGYVTGSVRTQPLTATVSGPETAVVLVESAVALLDVTGETEDIQGSFPLEARDGQGVLVKGVVFDPAVVDVTLDIQQREFARTLIVSPILVGIPAAGYSVSSVSVEPVVVTVIGPSDLLNMLSIIRTAPIDIGGASSSLARMVALELPAGVRVSGNAQVSVRVTIDTAIIGQ